jgi:hypothetical protein
MGSILPLFSSFLVLLTPFDLEINREQENSKLGQQYEHTKLLV